MKITWHDRGREPTEPANPEYPHGIALDISRGVAKACTAALPYPAKRCGFYLVTCPCGASVTCTTAGRSDDPKSIKVACVVKPRRA